MRRLRDVCSGLSTRGFYLDQKKGGYHRPGRLHGVRGLRDELSDYSDHCDTGGRLCGIDHSTLVKGQEYIGRRMLLIGGTGDA